MLISIKRLMETEPADEPVEELVVKPNAVPVGSEPMGKKPVGKTFGRSVGRVVGKEDRKSASKADGKATTDDPLTATMDCYRASLQAVGRNAAVGCPASGSDLEMQLVKLAGQLPVDPTSSAVRKIESGVEEELQRWASETAEYLREKTDGVKELLIMLARTAESVGERDHRYANQFNELTADLRRIADLDDLTQVRSSLVRKATELKSCVDTMAQESVNLITQLQGEVNVYETKLKTAEEMVLKDSLTGIANRRCAEKRMELYATQKQVYCVAVIDLNKFKGINDQYGHAAGDDLLKQFASELKNVMRATDLVARWGGDEFIVVLNCELSEASGQIERIHKWALGDYTIQDGASETGVKVTVGAAIGVAQWMPGEDVEQVIAKADAQMYSDKEQSRKR
jgi:diguanylate cyclase (GGDEF)-like protein